MKFQFAFHRDYPKELTLPWANPLDKWDDRLVVDVSRGISRHLVKFVVHDANVYAIKEINENIAKKEFKWLRVLYDLQLPVVQPIGLVTERDSSIQSDDAKALLVTRYLEQSIPYRNVVVQGVTQSKLYKMLDALSELFVRLHLAGFYWGDCSLSNTLFRQDAGRFAAYLVDAETGEHHSQLSDGQRQQDLLMAEQNVAGEFMDVEAGFGLPPNTSAGELVDYLLSKYEQLWNEINHVDIFSVEESYRIQERVSRLHDLGFDVEEMQIETIDEGHQLRIQPRVVEPWFHKRRLQTLTGLEVEENQARRLLNDLREFRVKTRCEMSVPLPETLIAYRWLTECYQALLMKVPEKIKIKLGEAETYHQLLEHRWFESEKSGYNVKTDDLINSFIQHFESTDLPH
ncbi:MAG: DUF4032 domain-containing protein [Pseudomonadota bacterium]